MRFGTHVFADEREAAEALLAEGFVPVGREGTRHYRHPDRDADRWVQRADVQKAKHGQHTAQVSTSGRLGASRRAPPDQASLRFAAACLPRSVTTS